MLKFGPVYAGNLRRLQPRPSTQWHLDEMPTVIAGKRLWLWRAVDGEGEILDVLIQPRRDRVVAPRLIRRLPKKQGYAPNVLVTDRLASYGCARRQLGLSARHEPGLRKNSRSENSHEAVRRRERKSLSRLGRAHGDARIMRATTRLRTESWIVQLEQS